MTLLETVASEEKLYEAFVKAKEGCDWKCSVQTYDQNFLTEIYKAHKLLTEKAYKPIPYHEFMINERGKVRHIQACDIRDRVIQKSLCDNVLNPILKKYLIYDNGASLEYKGTDFARRRLEVHLKKYYKEYHTNQGYILQMDFSKFFDSISHDKLIKMVEEKLPDDSVNWLFEVIINSFKGNYGIGIGSQVSQICGLYYPHEIDNYCKIVKGFKYYGRYMDDFYIIHPDKQVLQQLLKDVREICDRLELKLSEKKTHINKLDKIFIFLKVKYNFLEDGTIIKRMHRTNITRERRKLKKYSLSTLPYKDIENNYGSWRGSAKKFDSYRTVANMDNLYNELFIKPFINGSYKEKEKMNKARALQKGVSK